MDACGLFIDMPPGQPVGAGDWVATEAGSRYLVTSARQVKRRKPSPAVRYALACARLPRHEPVPADITCHWLSWYPRTKHRTRV